jgi:ABC-type uncharacterized transport system
MKMTTNSKYITSTSRRGNVQASSRAILLVAMSLVMGAVLTLGWYFQKQSNGRNAASSDGVFSGELSDATKGILQNLKSSVEVRLYVTSDPARLSESLRGFVSRVQVLLGEYDRFSEGRIKIVNLDPQTDAAAKASAGDLGILPFSAEGEGICYLGIAVICGKQKEVMPQLAAEWEAAFESDLSRAIARVSSQRFVSAPTVSQTATTPTPIDTVVSEELLKTFPDLESMTFDQAADKLRESALEELKSATVEMQKKVQAAQQNLAEARETKSSSEQGFALKEFQRVQSEQAENLKQITARLQERIVVLQRLKTSGNHPSPSK